MTSPAARRRMALSAWRDGLVALALGLAAWAAAQEPRAPAEEVEVRFGPEADYGPFVYADDEGRIAGLSVDMLGRVASLARLQIRTLPPRPLSQWLDAARRREVDLLSSLRPTPERAEYLLFTRPYVKVPAVLVVRQDHALAVGGIAQPLTRLDGQRVAVGAGYAVEAFVRSARPTVLWQPVPDDVVALRGVVEGQYAGAVLDTASAAFVARRFRMQGLATAGPVGFDYSLSFAVRKDRPDLVARIDAAIQNIPQAERTALVSRWMTPLAAGGPPTNRHPVLWAGLALLVAAGALAVAGWRRQRTRGSS